MRRLLSVSVLIALACAAPGLALAAKAPASLEDADVHRAVEDELLLDPVVSARAIDVASNEGVVTLSGSVDNLLAKRRAVARAEQVKGVRAVIDRITVRAEKRSDAEIQRDVKNALLADPATDSYELGVTAKAGQVTLRGEVESFAERNLAMEVARGVRGVTGVTDEIVVGYGEPRADSEIEAEIERRLESDVRVDAGLIEVSVKDGAVTLSGAVGSVAERSQARADAWTAGVQSVNDEALRIEWWARDRMRRAGGALPSDVQIEQAVRDALLYDPRVFSFNPAVEVKGGIVTLTGTVHDLAAKRAAEQDALNTFGVWHVDNRLRVRPEVRRIDEQIAQDVVAALKRDPFVDRFQLTVLARNGTVYLHGNVPWHYQRSRAEYLTARVSGVVAVENDIDVTRDWAWRSDWEIRENVRDQLFWSPFVSSDDVQVEVADGVVTLDGKVTDWNERNAAVENAYEGGARRVIDDLEVENRRGDSPYPGGFVPPYWNYWAGRGTAPALPGA